MNAFQICSWHILTGHLVLRTFCSDFKFFLLLFYSKTFYSESLFKSYVTHGQLYVLLISFLTLRQVGYNLSRFLNIYMVVQFQFSLPFLFKLAFAFKKSFNFRK